METLKQQIQKTLSEFYECNNLEELTTSIASISLNFVRDSKMNPDEAKEVILGILKDGNTY